jgi:hypothetical protein
MNNRMMAQDVALPFTDEEPPTRRSAVMALEYARETEALLARGDDPEAAQVLVETVRPPMDSAAYETDPRLESIGYLALSPEELEWFPLESECTAIVKAVDGRSSLREIFTRAEISAWEGIRHVDDLIEMGILALRS